MARSPWTTSHFVLGLLLFGVLLGIGAATFLAADRARIYAPPASMTLTAPFTTTPMDARLVVTKAGLLSPSVLRVEILGKQIAGDFLFEAPLLLLGETKFSPSTTSLKATRLSFLNSVTTGEAIGGLEFEIGSLSKKSRGRLVFNPSSQGQSTVAPRLEVNFEWGALPSATLPPSVVPFISDSHVLVENASFISASRLRVNLVSQTGWLLYAEVPLLVVGEAKVLPTAESFKAFTALAGGKRLSLEFDLDEKAKGTGSGRLIFNQLSQAAPGGGMSPRIEVIVIWK